MSKTTQKEIFTCLGRIVSTENGKMFEPHSDRYFRDGLNRIFTDKEISCTFSEHVATRSETQLAYHWVLVKYLAEYTGFSTTELHDAIMRLKFGTKKITLGGKDVYVRKSIADNAKMPKHKMVELVEYDLSLCKEYNIVVPTAEELGYIPNNIKLTSISRKDVEENYKNLIVPKGNTPF